MSIVPEEGSILSVGTNANNETNGHIEEYNPELGKTKLIIWFVTNFGVSGVLSLFICSLNYLLLIDCEPDYEGQISPTSKLRTRIHQTLSNIQGSATIILILQNNYFKGMHLINIHFSKSCKLNLINNRKS